jgi:hypothetical protein
MLPDIALLEIFAFYMDGPWKETWHMLVHVCQKWRSLVFGSPRRLKLRLYCDARTPVREKLDVWPLLPIVIKVYFDLRLWGMDNIIAALEHNDRICQIVLFGTPSSQLIKALAAMHQPFPVLTHLELEPEDRTELVDPASFLGGSAPHLQTLILGCIPFPGLPNLLLSATHLVHLRLWSIPLSGYISPEAMATCLSVLTRLEGLDITFESRQNHPDWNSRGPPSPPQTRALLPILTTLRFRGVTDYLEDFVARIDAPLLNNLAITFFNELGFDTLQLTQFIGRTPKLKTHDKVHVVLTKRGAWVRLPQTFSGTLELEIICSPLDRQLSTLAQVFSSSFPRAFIPAVKLLYIFEDGISDGQDDIENSLWLDLLHPFTAVEHLYISRRFTPLIAPSLQELVGERVTEVLPALQTLFLVEPLPSGPAQEAIGQFVAARQLACHPVAVSFW